MRNPGLLKGLVGGFVLVSLAIIGWLVWLGARGDRDAWFVAAIWAVAAVLIVGVVLRALARR